jgi:hypothetical protein
MINRMIRVGGLVVQKLLKVRMGYPKLGMVSSWAVNKRSTEQLCNGSMRSVKENVGLRHNMMTYFNRSIENRMGNKILRIPAPK